MSIVKSFAIGNGDMFYIRHGSDNFTIIDCNLPDGRKGSILAELTTESRDRVIRRFISTHPDQDHICGLVDLDDHLGLVNFYCVKNNATKKDETADFLRYCELRDSTKAFNIFRDCTRRWMNQASDERGSSGINILWPDTANEDYKNALAEAAAGLSPNNISCIVTYSLNDGVKMMWMGDLETDFMEKIQGEITLPKIDVLFAPHHGRESGTVPSKWLSQLDPGLIVIGEAPSNHINYYNGYNTITQNSTGDILFDCIKGKTNIYVADHTYSVDFLHIESGLDHHDGLYYIGTLKC